MALMIDRPVIDRPNFRKSCFPAAIVVSSCSKLFLVIKQMLTSTMELSCSDSYIFKVFIQNLNFFIVPL